MTIIRRGFFDADDLQEMNVGKNIVEDSCIKCGAYKNCINPKMPISGKGAKKIYVLAEAPGENESKQNTQLVGRAGQLLRTRLAERGIDLDLDCWKDNSIRCRVTDEKGENRKPTKQEIKCCKDNIDKSIKELKPDYIFLFGKSALESFYLDRFSDLEVGNWRNLCIPDKRTGAYVFPIYHPSYLLRNEHDLVTNGVFDRDLDFAVRGTKLKPFEHKPYLDYAFPLKTFAEVTDMLEIILKEKPEHFAFDYETTGLKPFNEGHAIAAISGCDNDDYAFSFLYDHYKYPWHFKEFKKITDLWVKILLDPDIKKIGHNSKFESVWSKWIFKIPKIVGLDYCTMNSAHIIDSQKRTGLKFQTYTNFGIDDYSKSIKKYLETTDAKGFNKVMDAPVDELLLYSATDSLMTKWLFNKQKVFFERHPKQESARQFFQKGLNLFADIQITGINANTRYYYQEFLDLTKRLEEKENELQSFLEVQQFKKEFRKELDFESTTDLRKLFFTVMKLSSKNKTTTGLDATDKTAINEINHPIAKIILAKRRIKKMRDYVGLFLKEINDDDRIRPFFNLHIPTTFRSSSDSPNWQNIPVRDEEAKQVTRLGIIPSKGNKLLDWDYGSIEVRTASCYTKDPTLIAYINDPSTDMHRDTAAELFKLNPKQVSKDIRFYAKNGFVFPEFYGSYYVSTAKTLWAEVPKLKLVDGTSLFQHLYSKGILTYQQFEDHVKKVEKEYWVKFNVFKKWQDQTIKDFANTGFVEMFDGFRVGGYLGKNEIINYRFQGTAFHRLLWSIIEIAEEIKKRRLKTKIIAQIHDCCIYDLVPEEQEEIIALSTEIATQRIRKEFPWIIVPLEIEFSITEIDESWYYEKEIKT